MSIELSAIPLAWIAGVLGILSPCVWPLVPVVMASAAGSGRSGPWYLAAGLSASFAIAGTLLTFALISLGLDPVMFRVVAAILLVLVGLVMLVKQLGDWLALRLSMFTSRLDMGDQNAVSSTGQFGVGALLGLVWLPCVGPTLGAAIALASVGRDIGMAFIVMLVFGVGTASVLIAAGALSGKLLARLQPVMLSNAARVKKLLGWLLLILGLMVLSGTDKMLEAYALRVLPDWAVAL